MGGNLDIDDQGRLVIITLQRPAARNALSMAMRAELADVLDELSGRDEVGVLVLTGADGVFCAGADIKEPAGIGAAILADSAYRQRTRRSNIYAALRWSPWVSIAAIEGPALGAGLEIALSCDLRVAGTSATLGLPEVDHGTLPGGGGSQLLPRFVGHDLARQMILLGRRLDGAEAHAAGLVSRLVDDDGALDEALAMADVLLARPAEALKAARYLMSVALGADLETGLDYEAQASTTAHLLRARDRTT